VSDIAGEARRLIREAVGELRDPKAYVVAVARA